MRFVSMRRGRAPFVLLLFASGIPSAQETGEIPGDPFERLEAVVRRQLGAVEAAGTPWIEEALADRLKPGIRDLLHFLEHPGEGGTSGREPLTELLSEDFACTPLRPALVEVASSPPFTVLRPEVPCAELGAQAHRGADGLRRAVAALRAPLDAFPAGTGYHAHQHVTGVGERSSAGDAPDEDFALELTLHFDPVPPEGAATTHSFQQEAVWRTRWRVSDGAARLRAIELASFEEVHRAGSETLFRDRTTELFGDDGPPDGLAQGISHWRERLDTRLGQPLIGHAAGIAIGDVDGDGGEDVYLCQPGGLPNKLFLRGADGSLHDASAASGADFLDHSRAALLIDLDADGRRDLVLATGNEVLFLGRSDEREGPFFVPRGATPLPSATMLAAADHDGDGDLDVYGCAYAPLYAPTAGEDVYPRPYHDARNGQPNKLLANGGDFRFTDATVATGLDAENRRFSFAASWEDFDRDGDPDLYVANDFGRNNLYRNRHGDPEGPRFVDVAGELGVEDLAAGMGVSWGDVNRDGWMDLYVSNMYSSAGHRIAFRRRFRSAAPEDERQGFRRHAQGNSLFLSQRGSGFLDDRAAGASHGGWAWGAMLFDMNQDGWLDAVSPNGFLTERRTKDL